MKKHRLDREKRTIEAMIDIYCRGNHKRTSELCGECRQLLEYAFKRLEKCPFKENKPACGKCPVHCYRPAMREQVRKVMRYSGPRMMLHHPLQAVLHLLDEWRGPAGQHPKT